MKTFVLDERGHVLVAGVGSLTIVREWLPLLQPHVVIIKQDGDQRVDLGLLADKLQDVGAIGTVAFVEVLSHVELCVRVAGEEGRMKWVEVGLLCVSDAGLEVVGRRARPETYSTEPTLLEHLDFDILVVVVKDLQELLFVGPHYHLVRHTMLQLRHILVHVGHCNLKLRGGGGVGIAIEASEASHLDD